jgi:hypothetical protein
MLFIVIKSSYIEVGGGKPRAVEVIMKKIEIKTKKDMISYLEWLKAHTFDEEDVYYLIDSLDRLEIIKTKSQTKLYLRHK